MKELARKTREFVKKYKDHKFSITSTHNTITIAIMQSRQEIFDFEKIDKHNANCQVMEREYEKIDKDSLAKVRSVQLNPLFLEKTVVLNKKTLRELQKIYNFISKEQREISHDEDYGSWPNFYIHMDIGRYDRPHVVIEK